MQINIDVDVEKIAQELLTKEIYDSSYSYSLNREITEELKRQIREQIVGAIKANLDISELKEKSYSKDYLKKVANEILGKELKELTEQYVKNWLSKYFVNTIERQTRQYTEEKMLPFLQKIVDNIIVVNQQGIDETIEDMEDDMASMSKSSYEAGQMQATEEIRKNI